MGEAGPVKRGDEWKLAPLHAIPVSLFILVLTYDWFALADRYAIFLYGHLGATPFDETTSSRYWMSGLVAAGAVMVLVVTANGLLGRVAAARRQNLVTPAWWRVWVLCAPALAVGIPLITMTVNRPTLPPTNAAACTIVALMGLALALMPGRMAARQPGDLAWLAADGVGLMPILLLLRAVELPARGLISAPVAYGVAAGSVLVGAAWLGGMTGLYAWRHGSPPRADALFAAGLALSYLLMPLLHHLLFTPAEYRYISTAANFFAQNFALQLAALLVAAALALSFTALRHRLRRVR